MRMVCPSVLYPENILLGAIRKFAQVLSSMAIFRGIFLGQKILSHFYEF